MSGKDCFKIIAFLLSIYFYECVLLETLILQLDKQTIVENGNLTLTCTGDLTSINGASIFVPHGSNDSVLVTKNQKGECVAHTIKSYIPQCHNDSSFSLTLLNVSNTQHGEVWYCEPWLLNGRSNSIHLSVKVPVKNVTMSLKGVKQPTILRCFENESLSLECNSSFGRPPPSITWLTGASYSDASAVTTMEIKPVLYNASDETYNYTQSYLTVNVSRTFNNKRIFCNATNLPDVAPVSSNYFTFDVHYPPVVEPIENSSIIEMNNFTTLCRQKVNGNPANTTVTWTRNKILESTDQYLNFIKVLRNNEGYYTCSARNVMQYSNGSTVDGVGSTSFYLSVMYPPEEVTVDLTKETVRYQNITDKFNVTQGSIVTLGCNAKSRPPASSYTWSGIMSASEGNITIRVTKNLSGNIICTARNTMTVIPGNISTTGTNNKTYSMNVQYPPEIENIQNITVVEFGKVSYTCPVTRGNPSETNYIWTRSVDNTERRSEVLLIDPVLRSHEGFYTFSVSNIMRPIYISEERGVSNKTLYLTVLYPPEGFRVTYNADNVSRELISDTFNIIEGTNLTLSCSADSNPSPLNNSWSGPMTSVNNRNLTVYVTKGHSGNYTCSANNLMTESPGNTTRTGSNYKSFHMEVMYPPEINQIQNTTAIEGQSFNLKCSVVNGNPYETTMKWIRMNDNRVWYLQTLSIINLTRSDDSTYTCIANNTLSPTYGEKQIGISSQSVNIEVLYKSSINYFMTEDFKTQNNVTVNESQHVSFTCSVDSNPKSFMKITFGGKLLIEKSDTNELAYFINKTKCTDAGTYFCHGNNLLNNPHDISYRFLNVYVNCAPRQSSTAYPAVNITNVTSVQHVSTTLTFKALAYPAPSIQWFRKQNSSWIKLEKESNDKIEIVSSPVVLEYNLTLLNISEEDYGQYRLDISNPFGSHTQLFNLIPNNLRMPSTVDIVGPAVGGAVGAVLAIALTIIIGLIIRSRISGGARETPIYQNTSSLRDRLSSVLGSGSNEYETLQTRGLEQQYQHLSSFGREGLTDQRKIYENLKLSRSREHPDIGTSSGLPTTSVHESQSVV